MSEQQKQWRYEREDGEWSAWVTSLEYVTTMAADPDTGTGLVQERIAPLPNPVRIEVVK